VLRDVREVGDNRRKSAAIRPLTAEILALHDRTWDDPASAMRAIFEALTFGPDVDAGDSAPRYCTLGGVAKMNAPERPFLVVNEYVCAELGRLMGLPTVPGVVVSGRKGETGFVSLRFGPKDERPPPALLGEFANREPALATGVVVFDCWIANQDRHDENMAYTKRNRSLHLYDHDRALLGTRGVARLTEVRDRHLLAYHGVARELLTGEHFIHWSGVVAQIGELAIGLALKELVSEGIVDKSQASATTEFLRHRASRIPAMIKEAQEQKVFARITQGFLT